MTRTLVPVNEQSDILQVYRDTPIGDLLAYHNLGATSRDYANPEMLIATCMDCRLGLRIPRYFAFVVRCAGGNLGRLAFETSFAIAVGGVGTVWTMETMETPAETATGARQATTGAKCLPGRTRPTGS